MGLIGSRGIGELSSSLREVFDNNLVSVSKANETKTSTVAQNRDLYRLLSAVVANASQADRERIITRMRENRALAEKSFAQYRTTPQADDERAAGNKMEIEWLAYQALIERAIGLVAAGDINAARALINGDVLQAFTRINDELTTIADSNNRQIGEGASEASAQEATAKLNLYMGIAVAFLAAFGLGIFISRLISTPIATAVASARRVASGDLTQPIGSTRRDEAGQLLTALGTMQSGLKGTIQQIASAADQLASAAEELNAVTEESGRGLTRQNDEIQLAATAIASRAASHK